MKKSLLNYQFYKSYRLPLGPSDKVFADICSKNEPTLFCKKITIEAINLSGINFSSDTHFDIGEEVTLKIYTKRMFNNWDFYLKGNIVRSFVDEENTNLKIYGVLLEKENHDSVLNYFLKDFVNKFPAERIRQQLEKSCKLEKIIRSGESIELFSLLNSILYDMKKVPFDYFLKDLNESFQCENFHIYLYDQTKSKLIYYKSSTEHDLLKTELKSNLYMAYDNEILTNLKIREQEKTNHNIRNFLSHPLKNKNYETIGIVVLTNSKNTNSFDLFNELSIRFISKIISYYLKDFASDINISKKKSNKGLDLFLGNSKIAGDLRKSSEILKNLAKNIFILGENGSKKLEYATYLHDSGKYKAQDLKIIDFSNTEKIRLFLDSLDNFDLTNVGTVIINEIANLSSEQQLKFYYYIKNQKVRIITVSTKDLVHLVKDGKFSKKLYSFLNEVFIHIPALRNRRSDLLEITELIIQKECKIRNIEPKKLASSTIHQLLTYHWPENFKELKHEIVKGIIRSEGEYLEIDLEIKSNDNDAIDNNKGLYHLIKTMVSHADKSIDYRSHSETLNYYFKKNKAS